MNKPPPEVASKLVSVIVPAFNAAATVVEAVQSALSQSHDNIEVLVIDDGSSDDTVAALATIDDPRLTVHAESHRGVSAARNRGIDRSQGEFVAFLDADDIWLPQKLTAQLCALAKNPRAAVAYCLLDRVDQRGACRLPHTRRCDSGDLSQVLPIWNLIGNGSNWLLRRSVFGQVAGFEETLEAAEDWHFSVRLAQHFEFVGVPEVLALYRQHDRSVSTDLRKVERFFRQAWRLLQRETPYPREVRRRSLAVHYQYLLLKGLPAIHSWRDSLRGVRHLALCGRYLLRDRDFRRQLGVTRRFVRQCLGLLRRPSDPGSWTAGDEYRQTGMVGEARSLADPSVIPDLVADEALFATAIAELQRAGHHHRVPYAVTAAIARVAFDENLTGLVEEVFGHDVPWVMWGANIRVDIPNAANQWHTDIESTHWPSITVVIGLDGCEAGNATKYIPHSQRLGTQPPTGKEFDSAGRVLDAARCASLACHTVDTFSNFGNGRFYAFDAKGWHCGDPATAQGRVMLFLHYQRANAPRVPQMKDWIDGTWFDYPAPYISSFDRPATGNDPIVNPQPHPQVNSQVATAPGDDRG
ncbi:MAG: glycosyltransferase family A protein [Planctomycetota bacterium]